MNWCTVHDAPEKQCCGEFQSWCMNWDGILDEDQVPSCRFEWRDDMEARKDGVLIRPESGDDL